MANNTKVIRQTQMEMMFYYTLFAFIICAQISNASADGKLCKSSLRNYKCAILIFFSMWHYSSLSFVIFFSLYD